MINTSSEWSTFLGSVYGNYGRGGETKTIIPWNGLLEEPQIFLSNSLVRFFQWREWWAYFKILPFTTQHCLTLLIWYFHIRGEYAESKEPNTSQQPLGQAITFLFGRGKRKAVVLHYPACSWTYANLTIPVWEEKEQKKGFFIRLFFGGERKVGQDIPSCYTRLAVNWHLLILHESHPTVGNKVLYVGYNLRPALI